MGKHAILSPSGATRWLKCKGSPALKISLGIENKNNKFAAEGSVGHDIAANYLREYIETGKKNDIYQLLDSTVHMDGYDIRITRDLLDAVKEYTDNIEILHDEGMQVFIEVPLPLEQITGEDATGTGDTIAISDNELRVEDLKLGYDPVDVEDNDQLMMYGLAAYDCFCHVSDIKSVTVVIHQPRVGGRKAVTYDVEFLLSQREKFAAGARVAQKLVDIAVQQGEGISNVKAIDQRIIDALVPSVDACKHCDNRIWCPALNDIASEVHQTRYRDVRTDPIDLSLAYERAVVLKKWVAAVEDAVKERLEMGLNVPGYEIVDGRAGDRVWTDEETIARMLNRIDIPLETIYNTKINSPSKIEKSIKKSHKDLWNQLQDYIIRKAPSRKIVQSNGGTPKDFGFMDLDA